MFLKINRKILEEFYEILKDSDKKELDETLKASFNPKKDFVKEVINIKNTYLLTDENKNLLALGGVKKINNLKFKNKKIGQIWLLTTKNNKNHKKSTFKVVKDKINDFKKEYDILFNFIYKTNFSALSWLEKEGFRSVNLKNCPNYKLFYYKKGEEKIDIRYFTCE